MPTPNTILLKHRGYRLEKVAAGTITPGDLLEVTSADKFQRHSSASLKAMPLFAVEAEGLTADADVAGGIDDNYVADDFVQAEIMPCGAEVYAWVAAAAAAIVIGAPLESDGAGGLRAVQDFTDAEIDEIGGQPVAQAIEAVDNSAGSARARIKVRVY